MKGGKEMFAQYSNKLNSASSGFQTGNSWSEVMSANLSALRKQISSNILKILPPKMKIFR